MREVAEVMGREAGYTTILKLMQIMTEKRLVRRDEAARTHVYEAAFSEDQTQRHLVTDLSIASSTDRRPSWSFKRSTPARRRRKSSTKSASSSTRTVAEACDERAQCRSSAGR